jgi:hypothetical protein
MDRESQKLHDLRVMMATPEAKRWVGAFLDYCHLYRSAYSDNPQLLAYHTGMQCAAKCFENALFDADPALPGQCREAYESIRRLNNQLKEEQEDE